MTTLHDALRYLDVAAFIGLGLVTFLQWRARRDVASRWAVLTFAALATATSISLILPDESDSTIVEILETFVIAVLVTFPYFLFRLATSFAEQRTTLVDRSAALLTAAIVVWSVVLPRIPEQGEPRSASFQAFVITVLIQWVTLSAFVAIRFWRAGTHQPDVARKRMKMLSVAATGMSVAIVVSGTSSETRSVEVDILIQVIVLTSVIAFFLAFSPPAWLRSVWRREAQAEVRDAAMSLMSAGSAEEIVQQTLPHAAAVVGGRGLAIFDSSDRLLGSFGFSDDEVAALDPSGESGPSQVRLHYPFGSMVVGTTLHTPYFGHDDISLLGAIGALLNLALQRLDAIETEKQLVEARLRRRQALEINDNIVQKLAVAHYSFELGQIEEGKKAAEEALRAAQRTISDLLGELSVEEGLETSLTRKLPASD